MSEAWKPIAGYGGLYEVSDEGRVRSWKVPGHYGKRSRKPKILKVFKGERGYLAVNLRNNDGGRTRLIHILMLETFVGSRPDGCLGLHADDVKTNNVLSNLRWGTHQENMNDREANGKTARGSGSPNAKLTDAEVREIREALESPYFGLGKQLARKYQVSEATISAIKVGRLKWATAA